MSDFLETVLEKNNILNVQSVFYRNLLARVAVYYCFTLEGSFAGVWGRYIPEIQDQLELSDSLLGTSVLFYYLGNVLAAPIVAFMLKRFGSRFVTTLGAWSFIVSLPLVGLANSFGILTVVTFAFGLSCGIMDISMNNSAILTEIVAGQPLLGSFHGSYSVAAALGSLIGGVFLGAGISTFNAFSIASAIGIIFSLATFSHMYNHDQEKFLTSYHKSNGRVDISKVASTIQNPCHDEEEPQYESRQVSEDVRGQSSSQSSSLHRPRTDPSMSLESTGTVFVTPEEIYGKSSNPERAEWALNRDSCTADSGEPPVLHDEDKARSVKTPLLKKFRESSLGKSWKTLVVFAAIGFLGAFGESSIVTWSVVFFERYIGANAVEKSLGFTCFMVCMGAGRFLCDYLRRQIGRRYLMRIGGIFAMGGLILVVCSVDLPSPVTFACLGFSLTGLGLSTVIPTVFSSAGHLPGVRAGTALAIVAGCSYSGSIVSSPLIGVLSDAFDSLRMAMLCDALLLGLLIPFSFGVIPEDNVFKRGHQETQYSRVQLADDSEESEAAQG